MCIRDSLKSDWSASAYNIAAAGLAGSYVQVYVPENFCDKANSLLTVLMD